MSGRYQIGDVILDRWVLTRKLGEGSYGTVFEAECQYNGLTYRSAVKIITIPQNEGEVQAIRADGMDEASIERYFRSIAEDLVNEITLLSRLRGSNYIVGYEDHVVVPRQDSIGWDIIIRMELLTPLFQYIDEHGMSLKDAVKLGIDMCKALELCKEHRIVHRDIKPDNIFVSPQGDYKLGDFGIARTIDRTTSGLSKKGTYVYMAPEVYYGNAYGSGVDIYSLGIVLYWLLNERRWPFMPPYPAAITFADRDVALQRRMTGEAIPRPKNGDDQLAQIVLRACAFDPQNRYGSPTEMRQDLEAVMLAGMTGAAVEIPSEVTVRDTGYQGTGTVGGERTKENQPGKKPIWLPILVAALAIVLVIVAAVAIGLSLSGGAGPSETDTPEASEPSESIRPFDQMRPQGMPENAVEYMGNHYYIYDLADWPSYGEDYRAALAFCKVQGGHMAVINSREENDFLYELMLAEGRQAAYFGFYEQLPGVWGWCNGEKAAFINWADGEPNECYPGEDYAMFFHDPAYPDGTWNDGDFGVQTAGGKWFICEWEGGQSPAPAVPDGPEDPESPNAPESMTPWAPPSPSPSSYAPESPSYPPSQMPSPSPSPSQRPSPSPSPSQSAYPSPSSATYPSPSPAQSPSSRPSPSSSPSPAPNASVYLTDDYVELWVGDSYRLRANYTPSNATIQWSSDDSRVVEVDSSGNVQAAREGSTYINVEAYYGGISDSDYCKFIVREPYLSLASTSLELKEGESQYLRATCTPRGSDVKWSSSNSSVARVDYDGEVHAVSSGRATIKAEYTYKGTAYSKSCDVWVERNIKAPTGYSIYPSKEQVDTGETVRITVTPNVDCNRVIIYGFSPSGSIYSDDVSNCKSGNNSFFWNVYSGESGEWRFYASVSNDAGSYSGSRYESYCTVIVKAPASWSSWSEWQDEYVGSSSTREVETRQVVATPAHTEYRYGYWRTDDDANWCPDYGASFGKTDRSTWYEAWAWTKSGWSERRMYDCGQKVYCGGVGHTHTHVAYRVNGVDYWHVYSEDGEWYGYPHFYAFWEETREVPATYKTQYRYRDWG